MAYAWRDNKTMCFLSSADDPTLDKLEVQRKEQNGSQILVISAAVVQIIT